MKARPDNEREAMKRILLLVILTFAAAMVGAGNKKILPQDLPAPIGLTVAGQQAPVQKSEPQTQARQSDRRTDAGIDARDEFDRTLLMRAAARNDVEEAKKLLARGADVNAKMSDGYTALMYGAFYGSAEVVAFLLDNGAEVNARHKSGLTALIEAAKQNMDAGDVITNYVGTVEALLKKGADVSVRDRDGRTALMYAEEYGLRNKQEIVRLLRNAGAKQ